MLEYTEDSSLHDKLGICLARRELIWSGINKIFIKKINDFSLPLVLTEPAPRQVQSKGPSPGRRKKKLQSFNFRPQKL